MKNDNQKGYFVGLDLGQSQDFTAMSVVERRVEEDGVKLVCKHLQRWPLRTSYPSIVAEVVKIINNPILRPATSRMPVMAVDATGVGAPVVDLFRNERMDCDLKPVMITGGDKETFEEGTYRVPKRELVSKVQVSLQDESLKIVPDLPDAAVLSRELEKFQVKINEHANDSYGAWREGTHDDLVLALALSLWATKFSGMGIWL